MTSAASWSSGLLNSSAAEEDGWAGRLSPAAAAELYFDWPLWARLAQLPPEGEWVTWLLMGGRGAGKTRAGAEWVRGLAAARRRADRAGGRDDDRGHRRDGRGAERADGGDAAGRAAETAWNGAPLAERGRGDDVWAPPIRSASADRSSRRRGATRSANGRTPRRPGTCCSSGCGSASSPRQLATTTPRPTKLLKRLLADPHDDRDADDDGGEPQASGAEFSERRGRALSRHGARGGRSSRAS